LRTFLQGGLRIQGRESFGMGDCLFFGEMILTRIGVTRRKS
jgi:hypothetical protein